MSQLTVEREYEKAKVLVRDMCTVRFPGKVETEYKRHLRIFVELIQGIMLYAVFNDKKVETAERDLIIAISESGNVFDLINRQAKCGNSAWQDIRIEELDKLTPERQDDVLRILPTAMELAIQTFITSFAEMDYAITPRDYLAELKDIVEKITVDAILSDGDDRDSPRAQSEYEASRAAFIALFKKKWEAHSPSLFLPDM